jgi:hypothetical protein
VLNARARARAKKEREKKKKKKKKKEEENGARFTARFHCSPISSFRPCGATTS